MKRVALVELSVFDRITPLVSAYLRAYALTDSSVRAAYWLRTCTNSVKRPFEQTARDILGHGGADIYAISCYVWNMGLVRRLVTLIRETSPDAHVLLGGPQVMHQAERYLERRDERVVVCNGEGEVTFMEYLRELTEAAPDLRRVGGLSFYRDGELITTTRRPRIDDLDSIPSPFLTGVLEGDHSVAILETTRGCPYHCGFCYWGAATNDRVYRFDEERVKEEIAWIARRGIPFLYVADANWGMLPRDIGLTEHLADCARRHGTPNVVYFSAAKNKPRAVTQIARTLYDAGLVASQPVSMQTLEPASLKAIARTNIKLEAFSAVQDDLRTMGVSSFVELIWPLPGETLDSYKRGVGALCERNAQTIITYPHLLLHNTPLHHDRERLRLRTRPAGGGVAEAEIVIATAQVSEREFADGMRYFYAAHAIHNTRMLDVVARYLTARRLVSYADLLSGFVSYYRTLSPADPIVEFLERSIERAEYYDIGNYGVLVHLVLHAERALFADHVREYVERQPWWRDPMAQALFEVDLVNRPYVYSTTPLDRPDHVGRSVSVVEADSRRYVVEIDERRAPDLLRWLRRPPETVDGGVYVVDHRRRQYPYMHARGLDHNAHYCFGMIDKVENITPTWSRLTAAPGTARGGLPAQPPAP